MAFNAITLQWENNTLTAQDTADDYGRQGNKPQRGDKKFGSDCNLEQSSKILIPVYYSQYIYPSMLLREEVSCCNAILDEQTNMITLKLTSGYMSFLSRSWILEIGYMC